MAQIEKAARTNKKKVMRGKNERKRPEIRNDPARVDKQRQAISESQFQDVAQFRLHFLDVGALWGVIRGTTLRWSGGMAVV